MKERIEVADLTIGMFVAELDRPWLETPFLLQGFLVESQREIDELQHYCAFVYVERERSTGNAYRAPQKEGPGPRGNRAPTPPPAPDTVARPDSADGLWDTFKRIIRAAFGGDAAVRTEGEQKPRRPATEHAQAAGSGSAVQPARASSSITALELDYLVPEARSESGSAEPTYVGEPHGKRVGWFATIRSWFGSGARIDKEHREETGAEPDGPSPMYPNLTTFEEEIPKAREAYEETRVVVDQVIADVQANRPIAARKVQEAVLSMVESVVRNADGFMWLARLKARDAATYDHGLNVAVFLLSFGRHLGLPKGLLEILGTAGLLQDVGKLRLPSALLDKRTSLTAAEREMVKTHVAHSVEILESSQSASPVLIETVAQHHERFDGSGYPKGLAGDAISMLGAMAGIVDTYAAMTNVRPYREPALPQEVLQQLYAWRGTQFNSELVEKFIQCIGIFPVGSLVELNTREVAIVMAHSQVRRLRPRLMLILDEDRQPYSLPMLLDLINNPLTPNGEPYRIIRGLQAGASTSEVYERAAAVEVRKHLTSA